MSYGFNLEPFYCRSCNQELEVPYFEGQQGERSLRIKEHQEECALNGTVYTTALEEVVYKASGQLPARTLLNYLTVLEMAASQLGVSPPILKLAPMPRCVDMAKYRSC